MLLFNPLPNKPWFLHVPYKSFENTARKEEIARNKQFLLYPQCFPPVQRPFCHFHQTLNCRPQTLWIWRCLKCVV